MWMVWLLWIVIAVGGLFMAGAAAAALARQGFDLALLLNAMLYGGCGLYGLPKLLRLASHRRG
jgi:hypothetical protein